MGCRGEAGTNSPFLQRNITFVISSTISAPSPNSPCERKPAQPHSTAFQDFHPQQCSTRTPSQPLGQRALPSKSAALGTSRAAGPSPRSRAKTGQTVSAAIPTHRPRSNAPSRTLPASSGQAPGSPASHTCTRGPVQRRGTERGPGGVIAGSALPGEKFSGCPESAGAAARLCSTLQSLQSEKGSARVISRQLPLS